MRGVSKEVRVQAPEATMGLPARLVSWELDSRQHLMYGRECRSFLLVCEVGAQDVCAITLLKSLRPIHSSLSFHGERSRHLRCPASSVWRRSSLIANSSGKEQVIEQVWEEYFADPSQWWDNRVNKRNSKSPDFKHKVTKKALWVAGWSTPSWAKSRLAQGKLQCDVGYHADDSKDTAQRIRLSKVGNGNKYSPSTSAKDLNQIVQGGSGNMHTQSARTTSEAIAVLRNKLEQGIAIGSSMYVGVLKRCLKRKDLVAIKEVHDCIIKSGMEQETYVANNLTSVYIRCGRLQDARRVFDELVKKNVFTWTIMIGGYAQHNYAKEAMEVFNQMWQEGVQPDEITYLSILKACASPSALKWGKEVHAYIRHSGLESDLRVGNSLVHMYAKCGSIDDARLVFDRMAERNVITWTAMIGAYAESGCGLEAYRLFVQMKQEGFKPDAITYVSILNACASAGALEWVKDVHRHACEAGLESDLRVSSALVHMYAKSGSIGNARLVFDRMEDRNVITWSIMIGAYADSGYGVEAYRLFVQMKQEGFTPNSVTYLSILNPCASAGALDWVKDVHRHACEAGLESDVRVGSALVHMYVKSGSIDDARLVFDRMEERNVITWNIMIGGYAGSGFGVEAYQLLLQMKQEGFNPDAITYTNILNGCASAGVVKEVHRHVLEAGLESDVQLSSALVHTYAKCGSIDDARLVFNRMEERDVVTWNTMIGAYAESGCGLEAYGLFVRMKQEGFKPDATTFLSILNGPASPGALDWVKKVHSGLLEAGLESDLRVGNALVHMYAKCGSIDDAQQVFDRMENRDIITWNLMIGGLAQYGLGLEALEFFRNMNTEPDGGSFVAVLLACSHAGLVDEGRQLFLAMTQEYGIEPTVVHFTCMVDLLGRAGHLEDAKLIIGNMPVEPNGVTWGALLGACRTHGNVKLAEVAAQECIKLDPKNAATYVLLSNIYAAAGKWEQVSLVRSMMQEKGIHKQPGRSCIEVDNKIHIFAAGDTSHPEAKELYAELKKVTEKIKAEGYIPDTQLVLRDINEDKKELSLCSHSEKLAIAYGLLRTPVGEPIRIYKNLRVCPDCHVATKFISKVTGREIVARDANRFHHFKDGACSCNDYW